MLFNKLLCTILLNIFIHPISMAQYELVPLKNAEIKKGIKYHYYYRGPGGFAVCELYLFHNGSFRYEDYTCMSAAFSSGNWTIKNNLVKFTSDIQNTSVPVKLLYRSRDSSDIGIKRLAAPVDLAGNKLLFTTSVCINSDTIPCYGGDSYCFGTYKTIDSVMVRLENGLRSAWLKVNTGNEIVQLIVEGMDLKNAIPYNETFKKQKNKLILLHK
jgi:hypothetical protein